MAHVIPYSVLSRKQIMNVVALKKNNNNERGGFEMHVLIPIQIVPLNLPLLS